MAEQPEPRRPSERAAAVHPRISVSAICTRGWELEADLAFYADAGIDQVGVSLDKLADHGRAGPGGRPDNAAGPGGRPDDAAGPGGRPDDAACPGGRPDDAAGPGGRIHNVEEGARRVAAAGLRVTNLLARGSFRLADPSAWEAQQQRALAGVRAAVSMGAECMVLTTGPAGQLSWEAAADALAAVLPPVIEAAAKSGVPLALEHTNSLRPDVGFLHTLHDTVDVARRLGLGVCMEVNACWGERELDRTVVHGVDLLRLVQVSDYVVGTLCTPDRAVPGDGDIPLARIIGLLVDAGYHGVFDIELIGPRIEEEGYVSAVPRAIGRVESLLAAAGI